MTTKEHLQNYYKVLEQRGDWKSLFSDEFVFINNGKQIQDKENAFEGIMRFFSMVQTLEVQEMVVADDKAGAVVRYHLQTPKGSQFTSDVAEFFEIQDGKIQAFSIYFDSVPYQPK
jgi:ketosteroid isomerase-like protein